MTRRYLWVIEYRIGGWSPLWHTFHTRAEAREALPVFRLKYPTRIRKYEPKS